MYSTLLSSGSPPLPDGDREQYDAREDIPTSLPIVYEEAKARHLRDIDQVPSLL